jgi:hypothetical protein
VADKSDHFRPVHVGAHYTTDIQAIQILSMTDYVKALQAKRICLNKTTDGKGNDPYGHGQNLLFDISGMPHHGQNWQVPFIQCDSRRCRYHGEEAYSYCHYPKLALAPSTKEDSGGLERAQQFQTYLYQRYPILRNSSLPAFSFRSGGEFIRLFESNDAVEAYSQDPDYGILHKNRPKLAMAIIFTGRDIDTNTTYQYTIRVNSTNNNAPEWAGPRADTSFTTPDTKRCLLIMPRKKLMLVVLI